MIRHRRKIYQPITDPSKQVKDSKPIGITLPFNNVNGIFSFSYTNVEQVLTNLRNLLSTRKGERIMQPEFGTDLHYFLFEQIVDEREFKDALLGEITSALTFWMPYVSVTDVNMDFNPEESMYVAEPKHTVAISLTLFVSGVNIYLPVRLFIAEDGTLTIT